MWAGWPGFSSVIWLARDGARPHFRRQRAVVHVQVEAVLRLGEPPAADLAVGQLHGDDQRLALVQEHHRDAHAVRACERHSSASAAARVVSAREEDEKRERFLSLTNCAHHRIIGGLKEAIVQLCTVRGDTKIMVEPNFFDQSQREAVLVGTRVASL